MPPLDEPPPDELPPDELPPDELSPDELPPDELPPDELPPDELPPDELAPPDVSTELLVPPELDDAVPVPSRPPIESSIEPPGGEVPRVVLVTCEPPLSACGAFEKPSSLQATSTSDTTIDATTEFLVRVGFMASTIA